MTGPNLRARVLFAGGGTGGHLFPAIAIADRLSELLRDRSGVEILFVGTKNGLEYRMRDSLGYPLQLISMRGMARSLTAKNLLLPIYILAALGQSARLLRSFQPDVVVGTGGYVSWPVVRVAALLNLITVLQEQNSYPGVSTRRLVRHARRIYLGFKAARAFLPLKADVQVTGNPVRASVLNGNRQEAMSAFKLDPSRITLLVLGGSQGARAINNAVLDSLHKGSLPVDYQLLWQTGKRDYTEVAAKAGSKAKGCTLFPFTERMDLAYAAADLAIARAGALTLAELVACGLPSILIPYPFAAGDHQRKNAAALAAQNMATVLDEKQSHSLDLLCEAVGFHRSERYQQMKQAIAAFNAIRRPAVDVIAEDIVRLIRDRGKGGE